MMNALRRFVAPIVGVGLCGLVPLACAADPSASHTLTASGVASPPVVATPPTALARERAARAGQLLAEDASGDLAPVFVEVVSTQAERDPMQPVAWEPYASAVLLEQSCTGATAAWFSLGSTALSEADLARLDALVRCLDEGELDAAALRVVGHATPLERALYGRELALHRATLVADYLAVRARLAAPPPVRAATP